MPERSGHLHEISAEIGEIKGMMKALDRYTHEREHGLNNLSQKVDALGTRITRDIAAVEGRIEGRIKAIDDRVAKVEFQQANSVTERNTALAILKSPLVMYLVMLAGIIWASVTGRLK